MNDTIRAEVYRKPHFSGRTVAVHYPYAARLWHDYDCFALSILDGGAFFFSNAHFGAATGSTILRAWESGELLSAWKAADGRIDWDKYWRPAGASACLSHYEQHVWLNRLYCLLPLAQAWLRTGDKRYARGWLALLESWFKAHPPVAPLSESSESRSCWHDMQTTTRLIMLLHSVFLLSHGDALTAKAWRMVYRLIHLHATRVFAEAARAYAVRGGLGNHYQQKGAALVMAGVLFPEFREAGEWVNTGCAVLRDHARREILADGASVEASPSYSHFIARLCLDPHLLLVANGHAPLPGWEKMLRRQYAYLARTCDPAGCTLQVSDSYRLNARADVELARKLWPALGETPRGNSRWFAPSGFGVLRKGAFDIALDAGKTDLWHHHRGKPNLLIWRNGEPLLVDTGCPNYDEDIRERWCKGAAAHNVVTVEPCGAAAAAWDEKRMFPVCECLSHSATSIELRHTCKSTDFNYVWQRSVTLRDGACFVTEKITADRPAFICLHLHLAPVNVGLRQRGRQIIAGLSGGDVEITLLSRGARFEAIDRPAIGPDNHWGRSLHLSAGLEGRTATIAWKIV